MQCGGRCCRGAGRALTHPPGCLSLSRTPFGRSSHCSHLHYTVFLVPLIIDTGTAFIKDGSGCTTPFYLIFPHYLLCAKRKKRALSHLVCDISKAEPDVPTVAFCAAGFLSSVDPHSASSPPPVLIPIILSQLIPHLRFLLEPRAFHLTSPQRKHERRRYGLAHAAL